MKTRKHIFLIAIVVITVLSLLLSACGPIDNSNGNPNKEKTKDKDNGNQKEKDNNKDQEQDQAGNANKITICHKTGSAKNPYVDITVSENAVTDGHATHAGDLIPAPEGGCPDTVLTDADLPAK